MKKKSFLFVVAIFAVTVLYSQMKLSADGKVCIGPGDLTNSILTIRNGSAYPRITNGTFISSGDYCFHTAGYTYPRLKIKSSNGYVGINIGQSDAYYTLDVRGDIRATGQVIDSDERLKDDIKDPGKDEIDQIYELKAKNYKLKKRDNESDYTDTNRVHYGFIAQELKKIYPDFVYEDSLGYLSINYIELIPMLVEALKEQNERIEYLENRYGDFNLKNSILDDISNNVTRSATLIQNKPNPFSENTIIEFFIPQEVLSANIYIYDLQGKQKKRISVSDRNYSSIVINGYELMAGIYYYSLILDGQVISTKKMILTD